MPAPTKPTTRPSCVHCGAPLLDERARQSGFCCAGCSYVHRMVVESGLGEYYHLKDEHTAPADPSVFQPRDYSWLDTAQQGAESAAAVSKHPIPTLSLSLQGISCAGCVWLVERLFLQFPGSRDVIVNAQTGEIRLRWNPGFSASAFARHLQGFGYLLGPAGEKADSGEARDLVRRMGLCAAFAMNVMLFTLPTYFGMEESFEYARLFGTISLAFGTLSMLVGGTYFLGRALRMLREGQLHIDLPIAIGILGSYLGSLYGWLAHQEQYVYFDFVSTFVLLMLTGRWAQVVAIERNQRQILRHQLKPPRVRVAGGTAEAPAQVAPEDLRHGQEFFLASGQSSPVEARLLDGDASMSLASINGESEPRLYRAGELIPSGALNIGRGELRLEARQVWADSLLARLVQPGERMGWRHRFLEKVIRGYLIGIFIAAFLSGLGWWLGTHELLKAGSVVTAVLVVSCPCAIGLAFPLADEMAATALRKRGVFVRENDLWAKLSRIRRIIFDKTGTLTLETPELDNPGRLAALGADTRSVLYSLVRDSSHPVSQSLLSELLASGGAVPAEGELSETVGAGVSLRTPAGLWRLGRADWALEGAVPATGLSRTDEDPGSGTTVVLSLDGRRIEAFRFVDHARADAADELQRLSGMGYSVSILSGDHPEKVSKLALQLGLPAEAALGAQSPTEKAAWIAAHDREDTLMLGDGANDSLAFDKAFCRGTPVIHRGMLEQRADFYYLGRGISGIRALFEIDRIRRRTQLAIIVFSIAYNLLAVGTAVAGFMNPLIAAVIMPLNSLLGLMIVSSGMRGAFKPS